MNKKEIFLNKLSLSDINNMTELYPPGVIARVIVEGGAISIRDVENGEKPFEYSSGNFGPGYISIKGIVSNQKLLKFLVKQLALKAKTNKNFDGIAGLVTGGLHPSAYFRDYLQELQSREIVWIYIRDIRKPTGTKEHITGISNLITGGLSEWTPKGMNICVFEELTNYSNSLVNGAKILQDSGYACNTSFSILDYCSSDSRNRRKEANLKHTSLITLPDLLYNLEKSKLFEKKLMDSYRQFQENPRAWQEKNLKN